MARMHTARRRVRRSIDRRLARAAPDACEPSRLLAGVSGTVFDDGVRDAGEPGVAGVTVFADRNFDGVLQSTELRATTDANGLYRIAGIVADNASSGVRLAGVDASRITAPAGGGHSARFASDYEAAGRNFGFAPATAPTAAVTGTVYADLDGDGIRDAGEAGRAGTTVYADLDYDGVKDATEPSAVTFANGAYGVGGIPTGTASVAIRLLGVPASQVTAPAGGAHSGKFTDAYVAAGRDFGVAPATATTASVTGLAYRDANANGRFDAGEGFALEVYVDANGRLDADERAAVAVNGRYAIAGLAVGATAVVRARNLTNDLVFANLHSPFDPARTVTPTSAGTAVAGDLLLTDVDVGTVAIRAYGDANGDGAIDGGETATIPPADAWLDLDGDGLHGKLEPAFQPYTPGGDPRAYGYELAVPFGTYRVAVRYVGDADARADAARAVTIVHVVDSDEVVFVVPIATATVAGTVFGDLDGDGVRGAGEPGLAGKTVYADLDYDGIRGANEPAVVTDAGGLYSIGAIAPRSTNVAIRLLNVPASQVTAPAGGLHSGRIGAADTYANRNFGVRPAALTTAQVRLLPRVATTDAEATQRFGPGLQYFWLDTNRNNVRDGDEPLLAPDTAGDPDVAPYRLDLTPGPSYRVAATSVNAFYASAFVTQDFVAGTTPSDLDFVVPTRDLRPIIFAYVSNDLDGNGTRDAGEPIGLPGGGGTVVFADFNSSHIPEAGEPRTNTYDDPAHPNYNGYFALKLEYYDADRVYYLGFASLPPGYRIDLFYAGRTPTGGVITPTSGIAFGVRPSGATTRSGLVYGELNANVVQEPGELPIAGRTVFADLNGDHVLDAGEPSAVSGAGGRYTLVGVPTDPFDVALVPELNSGCGTYGDLVSVTLTTLTFAPYFDDSANGAPGAGDAGEPSLAAFAGSGSDGLARTEYRLVDSGGNPLSVPGGSYQVAFRLTGDADALADGAAEFSRSFNYEPTRLGPAIARPQSGFPRLSTLTGTLFNDGTFDAGESRIADRVVYADTNDNGRLDPGESLAISDAGGNYSLDGVRSDGTSTTIRVLTSVNEAVTTPVSQAVMSGRSTRGRTRTVTSASPGGPRSGLETTSESDARTTPR